MNEDRVSYAISLAARLVRLAPNDGDTPDTLWRSRDLFEALMKEAAVFIREIADNRRKGSAS